MAQRKENMARIGSYKRHRNSSHGKVKRWSTRRRVDRCMLALIGCTWDGCPLTDQAACMPPVVPPHLGPRLRRTSISRMSSKDKICLHEREKHPPPALQSSPAEDDEEEGQTGQSQPQSQTKASSSSSSEEESESESDAESGESGCRCLFIYFNYSRSAVLYLRTNELYQSFTSGLLIADLFTLQRKQKIEKS